MGEVEGAIDSRHLVFGVSVSLDWMSLLGVWWGGLVGRGG